MVSLLLLLLRRAYRIAWIQVGIGRHTKMLLIKLYLTRWVGRGVTVLHEGTSMPSYHVKCSLDRYKKNRPHVRIRVIRSRTASFQKQNDSERA